MDSIIFDVDGTLWDSTDVVAKAWTDYLRQKEQIDLTITAGQLKTLFGKPLAEIAALVFPKYPENEQLRLIDGCCEAEHALLHITGAPLYEDLEKALQNPMKAFGKTGYVYSPYVLCRTLEQWAQRRSVRLPDDIRPVLEATYADRDETDSPLALALRKLEEDKRALRNHAYDSTAQWGNTVSEETVTTRAMQRLGSDVPGEISRMEGTAPDCFPVDGKHRPCAGKLVGKRPQTIRRPFEQIVALLVCGAQGWRAAFPVHRRTQGRRHA